jgi:hypothetical protein
VTQLAVFASASQNQWNISWQAVILLKRFGMLLHLITICRATVQWRPLVGQWAYLLLSSGCKKEKRTKLGLLFTFWWQLWKERNRRVFQGVELSSFRVAALFKEQTLALSLAGNHEITWFRIRVKLLLCSTWVLHFPVQAPLFWASSFSCVLCVQPALLLLVFCHSRCVLQCCLGLWRWGWSWGFHWESCPPEASFGGKVLSYAFVSLLFCPGYVRVSFCNLRFVCFSSPLNKWQSSCPFSKKKKFVHDAIQVSH